MSRIGIVTFQFAHNYGALLQAYALRFFLIKKGHDVLMLPYYPKKFQIEYEISPFLDGLTLKQRIGKVLRFPGRFHQYNILAKFIRDELNVDSCIEDRTKLPDYCDNFDYIVFGSDQIWNTDLTNNDYTYFGKDVRSSKVAYAASAGKQSIQEDNISEIKKCLNSFKAVSIREESLKYEVESFLDKTCENVVDPVFLLSKDEWVSFSRGITIKKPYMLVYMLEEDSELIACARKYAEEKQLEIYEIHPIRKMIHKEFKQLADVGPKEFIYLISNCTCLCTNSFHAVSFSIIFRKECIHIPNRKAPERTLNLLREAGINEIEKGKLPLYGFDDNSYSNLEGGIIKSKEFLHKELEDR